MSARLIVGIFAIIDRLRKPHRAASPATNPRVAVLIPAYNEEKVIVRTIRSVLNSDYKNLHVIVIDDGSSDRTARSGPRGLRRGDRRRPRAGAHQAQRRQGRRAQLRPRSHDEEIYVGIDADTVIAADAISKLIPHFEGPAHRRHGRQRQGRQPRQPVDPLAGPRIHHQPELRAPRARPLPRRHRRSRRHRRMAHRAGQSRRRLSRSTPSPKTPTSP
jgi:hypothetical protein